MKRNVDSTHLESIQRHALQARARGDLSGQVFITIILTKTVSRQYTMKTAHNYGWDTMHLRIGRRKILGMLAMFLWLASPMVNGTLSIVSILDGHI